MALDDPEPPVPPSTAAAAAGCVACGSKRNGGAGPEKGTGTPTTPGAASAAATAGAPSLAGPAPAAPPANTGARKAAWGGISLYGARAGRQPARGGARERGSEGGREEGGEYRERLARVWVCGCAGWWWWGGGEGRGARGNERATRVSARKGSEGRSYQRQSRGQIHLATAGQQQRGLLRCLRAPLLRTWGTQDRRQPTRLLQGRASDASTAATTLGSRVGRLQQCVCVLAFALTLEASERATSRSTPNLPPHSPTLSQPGTHLWPLLG